MKIFCSDWPYLICVLVSNIYPKIKFMGKKKKKKKKKKCFYLCAIWFKHMYFFFFFFFFFFFTFLCWIWIIDYRCSQYCENFRKIELAELIENPPPSYLPNRFLHNLHSFFTMGKKVEIFDLNNNNNNNKKKNNDLNNFFRA